MHSNYLRNAHKSEPLPLALASVSFWIVFLVRVQSSSCEYDHQSQRNLNEQQEVMYRWAIQNKSDCVKCSLKLSLLTLISSLEAIHRRWRRGFEYARDLHSDAEVNTPELATVTTPKSLLMPAALASVSFGFVLVRVRVTPIRWHPSC